MREVLEEGKPLSQCLIWPLIEQFYAESGPAAWEQTPYYPTSNAYIAETFAELMVAFLRDSVDQLDPSEPVYIVELAAGMGAFALFCVDALEKKRRHFPALAALDLRYVLTDFTEKNLARWAGDAHLSAPLFDDALVWPERDTTLSLRRRGSTLAPGTLKNPLIVVANYFFDSIRHDFFHTHHGTLYATHQTVWRTPSPTSVTLDQVQLEDTDVEIDDAYYPSPAWNALLTHYRESLPVGSVLLPIGALATIDNLLTLSGGNLLLLSADKGWHSTTLMEGHYPTPYVPHTGSFSYSVNFHALGRYFQNAGGQSWHAHENPPLTTFAAVAQTGTWENLSYAAHQRLEGTDPPKNTYALAELLTTFAPQEDTDPARLLSLSLACVQLAHHDPWVFQCCAPYLQRGLPYRDATTEAELRSLLSTVEPLLSPLVFGCFGALSWLRNLWFLLDDNAACQRVNERALALFGPHRDYWFYRGAMAEQEGQPTEAIQHYRNALALDPACETSRTALQRLLGGR